MKQIWPNYSYSPATNVLTLTGLNIDRDQLLLVTAADRGRIMYNFADSSVTASAFTSGVNTALTLVATTAGLTTTASLVIYYDDQLQSTAVTISNFPATQVIYGTVDANVIQGSLSTVEALRDGDGNTFGLERDFPVSGTVTANIYGYDSANGTAKRIPIIQCADGVADIGDAVPVVVASESGTFWQATQPVSLTSTTVTVSSLPALAAGTAQIGSVTASISNTVPVSGTFWQTTQPASLASLPALAAGTAQIGSVTASLAISSSAITSGSFSSLTSATLVPANTARKMATVYNLGAGQLFINAGASSTTLGGGFMVALSSGDFYECDYTTTTLSAIFATAGTASWVSH
ncbi:MAG: hypothetical protein EBX40_00310 [Gammaproteobacteria bacterium]|nr:hypothetical protein [Gammaproteobacteria bacterium]